MFHTSGFVWTLHDRRLLLKGYDGKIKFIFGAFIFYKVKENYYTLEETYLYKRIMIIVLVLFCYFYFTKGIAFK